MEVRRRKGGALDTVADDHDTTTSYSLDTATPNFPSHHNGNDLGDKERGRPMHELPHTKATKSLLEHTQPVNLRGLFNLLAIVVVVQNARLVIENFLKYGLLVKFIPTKMTYHKLLQQWPVLVAFLVMHLIILGSFITERHLSDSRPPLPVSFELLFIKGFLGVAMIAVPQMAVQMHTLDPVASTILLCFAITWALKTWSFHHTLLDLRLARAEGDDLRKLCGSIEECRAAEAYPESLSLWSFYEYMLMPTVCFQLWYPRTERIRWFKFARSGVQCVFIVILIKIVVEQYILKTIENTFLQVNLETMSRSRVISILLERLLKLSIPTLIIWLLIFYLLFHHWLNMLAEITRFADRSFYSDWWNCASFGEYWRKWNLPIHNFAQRHMHKPMLRRRVPRFIARNIVFLLSAVLHEYLVVVPLGVRWNGFVVLGFMLQIPLMFLTSKMNQSSTVGNVLFWVTFCFTGQPMTLEIFYCLWAAARGVKETLEFQENVHLLLSSGHGGGAK